MSTELPKILQKMRSYNYAVFEKLMSPNLVAIRSYDRNADSWNDIIGVLWRETSGWKQQWFPCTTDPGSRWLATASAEWGQPGTAIIVPGQYPRAYTRGWHNGKHEALVQSPYSAGIKVWRDGNKDNVLDDENTEHGEMLGHFGINVHTVWGVSKPSSVGAWSAGCIVLPVPSDLTALLSILKDCEPHTGISFTLTLLDFDKHELSELMRESGKMQTLFWALQGYSDTLAMGEEEEEKEEEQRHPTNKKARVALRWMAKVKDIFRK